MTEKRSYKRSPIELAASCGIQDYEEDVKTKDISAGGLCIRSTKRLRIGEKVILKLEVLDQETICVNALVCWSTEDEDGGFQFGVKIDEVSSPDFDKYYRFYCSYLNEG